MLKQQMTDKHRSFLNDCMSMELYKSYIHKKVRLSSNFNEDEFNLYHNAYVKLVHSHVDYSGEPIRNIIKVIVDSTKSQDEKYEEYKRIIQEATEQYNKVNILHKRKQIKL